MRDDDPFRLMESTGAARCLFLADAPSGLRAIIALDDVTLGPAAGGVRTMPYASVREAVADAAGLACAMTRKCALAGLPAGGGKAVVVDHPGMKREAAFRVLGREVEALGGIFRTAGDLGTTAADLAAMAEETRYVHQSSGDLERALARGLLSCLQACVAVTGGSHDIRGLRVAIQGCGAVGSAVARALLSEGATLLVADTDSARADALGAELGARRLHPDAILAAECDVLCPCAAGGVVDDAVAHQMNARILCGAANNILASDEVARTLLERGILHVPDVVASAGAVIEGIGASIMGLADRGPLIDALGTTTRTLLERSLAERRTPHALAIELAESRIEAARKARRREWHA